MSKFENVERNISEHGFTYVRYSDYEALLNSQKELIAALDAIVNLYIERDITRLDETRPTVEWEMKQFAQTALRNARGEDGGTM